MRIGVPKEIKVREYRVGLIPANVRELVAHGHHVSIETNAGAGIGMTDEHYAAAGAEILPSAEDIYLFRAVGKSNPRDERLLALAEVRDLTPVRNGDGHISSLPSFERSLYDACGAIRLCQAARSERKRLQWNRVVLYVW